MRFRVAVLSLALAAVCAADTLTLRSGRVVQGSYLGGTSRQVRMAVADRIETFDVNEVESIRFETGQQAAAAAQPAVPAVTTVQEPAPAAPTGERRREILRPEAAVSAPKVYTSSSAAPAEVPAGTAITIRMIDDVDSQNAQVGQTFRASVDEPVTIDGRTVIPRGADVITKLVEMKDPSKLTGGGQLTLDLASITVNGRQMDIQTESVTQAGESRTGSTAKVVGGTAVLGAVIGAIAGGGRGAAIGAVSGAGAGTAIQVLTQGTRVRVPSETRLTFTLQQPLRIQ